MCEGRKQEIGAVTTRFSRQDDDHGCSVIQLVSDETSERDLSGLLQLPDIDDTSMAYVFAYVEHYREDLFWSLTSDTLFILGSSMFLRLSVWSFRGEPSTMYFLVLSIAAPMVYVLNSIVDIVWANRVRRRSKVLTEMQKIWTQSSHLSNELKTGVHSPEAEQSTGESQTILKLTKCCEQVTSECHSKLDVSFWEKLSSQLRKIRRHAAHRRTVYAALSFGLAALAGFISVLVKLVGRYDSIVYWSYKISVHMYIVSALMSVTGKRTRPWLAHRSCLTNHESLEDLGDLLFLFGSLVDGVLCDYTFDDKNAWWSLLSASLWLLDACFYLLSDFTMVYKYRVRTPRPGSSFTLI